MKKEKITKDMNLQEILTNYPESAEVLMNHGFHCSGCMAANFETIEQAAQAHGVDLKKLLKDLNSIKK